MFGQYMPVGQNQWYHFGVTTHFVYFVGIESDVHQQYVLAFDPQPYQVYGQLLQRTGLDRQLLFRFFPLALPPKNRSQQWAERSDRSLGDPSGLLFGRFAELDPGFGGFCLGIFERF